MSFVAKYWKWDNAKGHLKVRYFSGLNSFINYKTEFLKGDVSVSL